VLVACTRFTDELAAGIAFGGNNSAGFGVVNVWGKIYVDVQRWERYTIQWQRWVLIKFPVSIVERAACSFEMLIEP